MDDYDDEMDDEQNYTYTTDEEHVALPFEDAMAKGQVLVERLLGSFAWFASLGAVLGAGLNQVTGGAIEQWWPQFPMFQGAAVVLGADAAGVVTLSRAWRAYERRRYGAMLGWSLVSLPMFWLGGLNVVLQGISDFAHIGGTEVLALAGLTTASYALVRSVMLMAVLAVMTVARHKPIWKVERAKLARVNQYRSYRPRAASRTARGGLRPAGRGPRGPVGFRSTTSAETRVRATYEPGMGTRALARAAGVSPSTAAKWRAQLEAEQAA